MNKKKPLNYFERQEQRLHPKHYHYYFLPDYLYYCGERWYKRGSRITGSTVILFYWMFCVVMPSSFYPFSELELSLSKGNYIFVAMALCFVPPLLFYLLRYRKERRSALMNHYQRSQWVKGIPVWTVCLGWLPLMIFEVWVLKALEDA